MKIKSIIIASALSFLSLNGYTSTSDIFGSIGLQDLSASYSVGIKMNAVAFEIGMLENSNSISGIDALYFPPFNMYPIEPYAGIGIYDNGVNSLKLTGSAGFKYNLNKELGFGIGYHTTRGMNFSVHFGF